MREKECIYIVCVCERETGSLLLYSRKLAEHCKPTLLEKVKIINKKLLIRAKKSKFQKNGQKI
mgnify:CR=1 FL=1